MTTILSIRPTGSVSVVEFDDGTSVRCTRDFVRRSNMTRGQQIEPVLADRLRESAAQDLALAEAERLNRRGKHSRSEISARLRRTGIRDRDIRTALDALTERGALDDQAVALALARRGLSRALRRDPELTWNQFRTTHGRRLALRGFGAAESGAALRQAWSERARSANAQH